MNSDISFFNVVELASGSEIPGKRISRFPARFEPHYKLPNAKLSSRDAVGCEIRYVTESECARITLYAEELTRITLCQGDFESHTYDIQPGQMHSQLVTRDDRIRKLPQEVIQNCRFSPEVMRIIIEFGKVYFHGLDTFGFPARKPTSEEIPSRRWLAYGSSITHADRFGYPHIAAQLLGVDLLNKGMSGSCAVEEFTAQFLTQECEWDFASLELGVNLRGNIDSQEFKDRVETALPYFTETGKPIFLITIFPNADDYKIFNEEIFEIQKQFRKVLREVKKSFNVSNLHLIEGNQILTNFTQLSSDLIHPTKIGHSMMGHKLAKLIKSII